MWSGAIERIKARKTPLTLAVIAQASNIGIWVTQEGKTGYTFLNLIIAVIAAFSIDLIIVSTAFIEKRSSLAWVLALATSIIALFFSALIAVYIFNSDPSKISIWSGLHISFPVLVFFYSWFLSITEHDDKVYLVKQQAENDQKQQLEQQRQYEQIPLDIADYRRVLIRKLLTRNFTNQQIFEIVGGNRNRTLDTIKEERETLGITEIQDDTL